MMNVTIVEHRSVAVQCATFTTLKAIMNAKSLWPKGTLKKKELISVIIIC